MRDGRGHTVLGVILCAHLLFGVWQESGEQSGASGSNIDRIRTYASPDLRRRPGSRQPSLQGPDLRSGGESRVCQLIASSQHVRGSDGQPLGLEEPGRVLLSEERQQPHASGGGQARDARAYQRVLQWLLPLERRLERMPDHH